jgi:hypothetical protein
VTRELDRKCAALLGWKNIEIEQMEWCDFQDLYGLPPNHSDRYRVPAFSTKIPVAFQYLIEELKKAQISICMNYSANDGWHIIVGDCAEATDENLATAITIAFLKYYEVDRC